MARKRELLSVVVLAALFALGMAPLAAGGEEAPRMTKEELRPLLGKPGVIVIDVRFEGRNAPKRIAGAVFEAPGEVDVWSANYPKGKKIVLYCS